MQFKVAIFKKKKNRLKEQVKFIVGLFGFGFYKKKMRP